MPKIFLRFAGAFCFMMISVVSFAQQKVEMADEMRSNGKIYVVVAVSLTILTGLFIYLFFLDKKMTRFEKNKD
jgi:uncharacterized membrane protein